MKHPTPLLLAVILQGGNEFVPDSSISDGLPKTLSPHLLYLFSLPQLPLPYWLWLTTIIADPA